MTLDARALVTIVRKGPGFELIVAAIARDENPRVCARRPRRLVLHSATASAPRSRPTPARR